MAFLNQFGLKNLLGALRSWIESRLLESENNTRNIIAESLDRELNYSNRVVTYSTDNNSDISLDTDMNLISSSYGKLVYDRAISSIYNIMSSSVITLHIPDTVIRLGAIPHSLKRLSGGVLEYYQSMQHYQNLESVESDIPVISEGTFDGCYNLSTFYFDRVREIGAYAFRGCKALSKVSAFSCYFIGDYAFSNCEVLDIVELISNKLYLRNSVFHNTHINSLTISANDMITHYGIDNIGNAQTSFSACTIDSLHFDCYFCPTHAFYRCNIKNISLPTTERCNSNSFQYNSFKSLTLNNIVNIGNWAFANNEELTTVILGSRVYSIGMGCFASCPKLEELYIKAEVPPQINSFITLNDFNKENLNIYVPRTAVQAYKDHVIWGSYNIQGYDFPEEESLE